MFTLPVGLKHALEIGECVLFVGAGVGAHLYDSEGNPAPDANDLTAELVDTFGIETEDVTDLAKIAAIVERRKGRAELENYLKTRLSGLEPDPMLQWFFTLRWRAIFTTNYDFGIQRAYELIPKPKQKPITITSTSEVVSYDSRFEVPIYHLHGTLFGATKSEIVITRDDYARFSERRRMLFELLRNEFAKATVLYLGYSNRDPNWNNLLVELISEFSPSQLPNSYRIAPKTDVLDKELLKDKNIESIDASLKDFYEAGIVAITLSDIEGDRLKKAKSQVPSDLIETFEKSPAAVVRLLSSWTYVNQAPFHETPNLFEFLRGDRPNWALASTKKTFERDIEETVYDELLDDATKAGKEPTAHVILAPAGYGVSTLLMTLAARLALEKVGIVFMLNAENASVLEGDIEFACSISPNELPIFIVDNAADEADTLSTIVTRLSNLEKRAVFLFGERLNQWRQVRTRPTAKEYELEPLSDPEINRLLDYLADNGVLNALDGLSRELQFSVVKERHKKELLVAMREATEGKSFDAILEDEFFGIEGALPRKLYLTVCAFYQYGAYSRADLLADLLGISTIDLYERTQNQTEGVILYDCIDEAREIYAARARHRTIAAVVWERCGDSGERELILQSALAKLNLNYKVDKRAFEEFTRSDYLVDSIETLDGRIRFFETACKKDPTNPYVRQHYARMLYRAGKHELALSQVDEGLRLDSRVRVLNHTKAVILGELATTIESVELARRRLAQSESLFKQGISASPRDEYYYQGLATLYFNWAKRSTDEEMANYLAKAEDTISEGLKKARAKDSLWIISSEIQDWLGNEPYHLKALENAVRDNPGSIVARHLLGRAYRKVNRPDEALQILEPVIRYHFDEFRAFVEYALILERLGKSYKETIAVLRQSTLYGLRDPRFIATLGGMLFLDNNFTESNKIFAEAGKQNFSFRELTAVQYRPLDPSDPTKRLRLKGKVVAVKAGYAIIENALYPRFLCIGARFAGAVMEVGLELSFEPAFSAKGNSAINPQAIK